MNAPLPMIVAPFNVPMDAKNFRKPSWFVQLRYFLIAHERGAILPARMASIATVAKTLQGRGTNLLTPGEYDLLSTWDYR